MTITDNQRAEIKLLVPHLDQLIARIEGFERHAPAAWRKLVLDGLRLERQFLQDLLEGSI